MPVEFHTNTGNIGLENSEKRRNRNLSGAYLHDRFKPDRKDICNYRRKYGIVVDI